jgi:RHS repeat-associated protein
MKKFILLFSSVFLCSLFSLSCALAVDVTVLGPNQYVRSTGKTTVYTDSFRAVQGEGLLLVENGSGDDQSTFLSSAEIWVNGVLLFSPSDFNKKVTHLEAPVNLTDANSIQVALNSKPGSYLTVRIIEDIAPPSISLDVNPSGILLGNVATLTWSTTLADTVTIDNGVGDVPVNGSVELEPIITTTYTATATGLGGTVSENATITVYQPPTVTITADPVTITRGSSSQLTWNSTYADSVTITPDPGSVSPSGTTSISPSETTIYTIIAVGPGGAASDTVTVEVLSGDPIVSIAAAPETISLGSSTLLTWHSAGVDSIHIDSGIGIVDTNGSLAVSPDHTTTYTLTGTGLEGTVSSQVTVFVNGNPELQPEGMFGELYNDLIPQDATIESYDENRFSVLIGLVHDESGLPLDNVLVTIHGHPEYGTVVTDTEGSFSIPVEGGAVLTVVYNKQGRITSHRQVQTTWNDIAIVETLQMLPEDEKSTVVVFDGNPATVITHTSTEIIDEFGSRAATVTFTGDNRVFLVDENGNDIQELHSINVRATEYVTPESMPAVLPPNSAYTYCTELKVDNAERVRFEKPVPMWVDNFLGFDVGEIVPVGYYDRDKAQWIPSDNGVVVRLLDTDNNGTVDGLDSTGDGQLNDLNNNGTFYDEVAGLTDSSRYQPDSTFWRAEVKHFTPWDHNWPYGPPADAESPNAPNPDSNPGNPPDDGCSSTNSYVKHKTRVFHEDIPIPGTDLTLHYSSNRVKGYEHVISIPASGATVPDSLKSIVVKLEVAGRTYVEYLPPEPDQGVEFVWDGKDILGNFMERVTLGKVSIGYVYDAVYVGAGNFSQAFAQAGSEVTGIRARNEIIFWKRSEVNLEPHISRPQFRFGNGWTLSKHHRFLQSKLLQKGSGLSESVTAGELAIIDTVAGNGTTSYSGDDGPATSASLASPKGVAVDATGDFFIADVRHHRIRKVDINGIITTVAGNGTFGYSGDNGPATSASLASPNGVAVDATGNIFIADTYNHRIRKVDTNGIITTVAGNGTYGYSGDNGPAINAGLFYPNDVAVDTAGNLFIADTVNYRIRKVDTNGIITTVAGNGGQNSSGDDGPATSAKLYNPIGVAVDTAGNLFITNYRIHRVRKVDTNGIITTVAGNGTYGYSGDNGPATNAQLFTPTGITVDTIGNLFIADTVNNCIRKVDTNGVITTVAGNGTRSYSGDNGPATSAGLSQPWDIAVDASGNLFIADYLNYRMRKVFPSPLAKKIGVDLSDQYVPERKNIAYIFTESGQHLQTIDSHTGTPHTTFNYDDENRLTSIDDRFGNIITIERDGSGTPTAIISPYGHRTDLIIDSDGNLTNIQFEDFTGYSFGYTNDGLMTSMTNPRGLSSTHDFNETGRVISTEDPENGIWALDRVANVDGSFSSSITSSENNTISHYDTSGPGDIYRSVTTSPCGVIRTFVKENQGLDETVTECGMTTATHYTLDDRSKRKIPETLTITTPAGLTSQLSIAKSYTEDADELTLTATTTLNQNNNITTAVTDYQTGTATVTSPEGRVSSNTFDLDNLLITDTERTGLLSTHFDYDSNGRLTTVSTGDRSILYTYDTRGTLSSVIDPLSRETTYSHDLLDRVTQIDRHDGSTIQFQYDAAGNMKVLTTPTPADNTFAYNGVNNVSKYTTPLNSVTTYGYDKERKLTSIALPSGKTIINTYTNGQLSQMATPEWITSYLYTCRNLPSLIERGTEQINYGYDGKLLTSVSQSGILNQDFTYTYNNDFNTTSFSYAGTTENIFYDKDQLPIEIGRFTITRNSENGLAEAISDSVFNMDRSFNGYGELSIAAYNTNGIESLSWNVTRDVSGRIESKTESVEGIISQYDYTYDLLGRLLTVSRDGSLVEEYRYDNNGNRTYEMNTLLGISGKSLYYSVEDHILQSGSTSFVFDYDDNLAEIVNGTETTKYNYSTTGELLNVVLPDGTAINYLHDALGRRTAKLINDVVVEKYLWTGLTTLLAVYDGNDNLVQRFEYADDRVPYAMTSSGSTYYMAYDQVGTLRTISDSSGIVVKQIDYDSFGNIINDTNPGLVIPFGFAGGLHDRDAGLVRFGFRDYSSELGRWTAKDPILFAGGDTNLYGYVSNDPVNWVDPWGLEPWYKNSRVRAVGSLGATKLAEHAATKMDPGPARGAVYLASAALATGGAADSAIAAMASYVVAVEVSPTVVGSIAASGVGLGFLGLSSYDLYLAQEYAKQAYDDFTWKDPCHDTSN